MTEQQHKNSRRTCEIVAEIADKRRAKPRIPRIEQALALRDAVIQFGEKRTVLVIHIHAQHGHIAERDHIKAVINDDHDKSGDAEGQNGVFVADQDGRKSVVLF